MNRGELTRKQAAKEIAAIIARVPDEQLPKPERIENRGNAEEEIAWWGGMGFHVRPLTSTPEGRKRIGLRAVHEAFQEEWLERERARRYGSGYEFRDGKQTSGGAR